MATLFEVGPDDVAATNDEWYTPRWIFDAASLVFDLDVCAPVAPEFRTCPARRYLTVLDDGLTAPWSGLVWMNPPYSGVAPWVTRWVAHPAGLALLPASKSAWIGPALRSADAICMTQFGARGRQDGTWGVPGFGRPDGKQKSYPTGVFLLARGDESVAALARVAKADKYLQGAYHVRPSGPVLP